MDTETKGSALEILQTAETALRALLGAVASAGEYDSIASLTELAKKINVLSTGLDAKPSYAERQTNPSSTTTASSSKSTYPKFVINDNKLVKIGWSKKENAPYEHKAPKEDVERICASLAAVAGRNSFRMEEMLPIELPDGSSVPSYQAYLTLAWLRECGLIDKAGPDGYRWSTTAFDLDPFETAWDATLSNT